MQEIKITAADLNGHDLGAEIGLIDPKTLSPVSGELVGIDQERTYGGKVKSFIRIESNGWRWIGHLVGDAPVLILVEDDVIVAQRSVTRVVAVLTKGS